MKNVRIFIFMICLSTLVWAQEPLSQVRTLITQSDCPTAVRLLEPLLVDDTVNQKAIDLLNHCQIKMRKFESLIDTNSAFLERYPFHLNAQLALTEALRSLGRTQAALSRSETLMLSHSESERAVCLRAKVLDESNLMDKAEELLASFIKTHPLAYDARLLLAEFAIRNQKASLALKYLEAIKKDGPISEKLFVLSGRALGDLKNYKAALNDLNFAIRVNPKSALAYIELSKTYAHMGDGAKGLEILFQALNQVEEIDQVQVKESIASIQMDEGYFEAARMTLQQIQDDIAPNRKIYFETRILLLEKKNSEAANNLQRFVKDHPNETWAAQASERIINSSDRLPASATVARLKTIVVKPGDTLSSIAKKVLGNTSLWKKLFSLNRNVIKNPDFIQIGMTLNICGENSCEQ